MTTKLKNTWTLTVGDWSADGHGMTDTLTFKSNYTLSQVTTAYAQASTEHQLKVEKECQGYDDRDVSSKFFETYLTVFANNQAALDIFADDYELGGLEQHFPEPEDKQDLLDLRQEILEQDQGYFNTNSYAEAYLFIAQLALPDLVWESLDYYNDNANIGGYGLLST